MSTPSSPGSPGSPTQALESTADLIAALPTELSIPEGVEVQLHAPASDSEEGEGGPHSPPHDDDDVVRLPKAIRSFVWKDLKPDDENVLIVQCNLSQYNLAKSYCERYEVGMKLVSPANESEIVPDEEISILVSHTAVSYERAVCNKLKRLANRKFRGVTLSYVPPDLVEEVMPLLRRFAQEKSLIISASHTKGGGTPCSFQAAEEKRLMCCFHLRGMCSAGDHCINSHLDDGVTACTYGRKCRVGHFKRAHGGMTQQFPPHSQDARRSVTMPINAPNAHQMGGVQQGQQHRMYASPPPFSQHQHDPFAQQFFHPQQMPMAFQVHPNGMVPMAHQPQQFMGGGHPVTFAQGTQQQGSYMVVPAGDDGGALQGHQQQQQQYPTAMMPQHYQNPQHMHSGVQIVSAEQFGGSSHSQSTQVRVMPSQDTSTQRGHVSQQQQQQQPMNFSQGLGPNVITVQQGSSQSQILIHHGSPPHPPQISHSVVFDQQ